MRRFLLRSARSQAPLLLLIAVLVVVICVGAGAAASGLRATADTMFAETLARAPESSREVTITFTGVRDGTPAQPQVGAELVELTGELAPLLGAPRMATVGPNLLVDAVNDRVPPGSVSLTPTSFADVDSLVEITEGRPPGPATVIDLPPRVDAVYESAATSAPLVEVALLPEAAERLDLPLGTYVVPDPLETDVIGLAAIPVMRVVGLYQPRSPELSALDEASFTRAPGIGYTDGELLLRGAALVDQPDTVATAWAERSAVAWTLPVDGAPAADAADDIAAAVDKLALTQWPFQETDTPGARNLTVVPGTSLGDTATGFAARRTTSDALLLLPLTGLFVAALVSIALAARLLARRRSRDTRTVYARGASVWQLGGTRAVEALLVAAPGIALGLWATGRLAQETATGSMRAADLAAVLGAAAAGVVTMTVSGLLRGGESSARSRRQAVADAGEAVVVVLAVGGVALLLSRGDLARADPVLLLVPVLVAAAATFVLLRLVRVLLGVGRRLSAMSKGLVALVGPTRAVDVSASSVLPSLAVVLALSVAVLGVAVTDTVTRGISDSGWQAVGADVQVRGAAFAPETVAKVERLAGVRAVAAVRVTDNAEIVDRTGRLAGGRLIIADAEQVRRVTARTPARLAVPADDGLRARVGDGVVPRDGTVAIDYGDDEAVVQVVGDPGSFAGFGWAGPNAVLVDLESFDAAVQHDLPPPNTLLVAGSPDTGALTAVVERAEPDAEVVTRSGAVAAQRDAPVTSRTHDVYVVATAAAAVLFVLGVLFAVGFAAPGRRRTGSTLRTLGASRRQRSMVAAVELVPTVLVAAVVGGLCGALVAWVAGSALDLRLLTGQTVRPAVRPDGASALLVAGLTALTATAAVGAALVASATRVAGTMSDVATEEES